jgi:hypothetical protein
MKRRALMGIRVGTHRTLETEGSAILRVYPTQHSSWTILHLLNTRSDSRFKKANAL